MSQVNIWLYRVQTSKDPPMWPAKVQNVHLVKTIENQIVCHMSDVLLLSLRTKDKYALIFSLNNHSKDF